LLVIDFIFIHIDCHLGFILNIIPLLLPHLVDTQWWWVQWAGTKGPILRQTCWVQIHTMWDQE
jgi:hypothetical protein